MGKSRNCKKLEVGGWGLAGGQLDSQNTLMCEYKSDGSASVLGSKKVK